MTDDSVSPTTTAMLKLLLTVLFGIGIACAFGLAWVADELKSPFAAVFYVLVGLAGIGAWLALVFEVEIEPKADPLSAAEHTASLSVITEYQRPWADPGSKIATLSGRARKGFGGHS